MKVGDLMYCTFEAKRVVVVLVEKHRFDDNFWNILWNGEVALMHTDHLVAV